MSDDHRQARKIRALRAANTTYRDDAEYYRKLSIAFASGAFIELIFIIAMMIRG